MMGAPEMLLAVKLLLHVKSICLGPEVSLASVHGAKEFSFCLSTEFSQHNTLPC